MSNMTYAYADQGNGKGFNSLWNLGLGYARATDCAAGGDWLNRAVAGADLITVAFGTNDIISGPYGGSGHATAAEIEDAVRTITKKCTDSGVRTIVWNSPPFDLSAELEPIRTEYNATVASIAADCGAQFLMLHRCWRIRQMPPKPYTDSIPMMKAERFWQQLWQRRFVR